MRHRICLLGLLVTVVSAFGFAAPASAQTDEEVRRLIDQLDGNFQVRTRAEATLVGYIRANRLTPAQLGILRTYPERPPLELLRRKERILAQWTILFPSVGRVLDGVRFETTEVVGRDWFYRFDGFYGGAGANEDDPSHPFAARLAQRYVAARNALTAADTAQVVAALQALRTHVSDNFGQSFLYTDEGRSTRATRQQVLDRIDRAIMDAQAAIRDIQIGSNNVQPPPRRPQPIQGRGAIDVGRTLRLALLIDPVVGGGLDVFMTPWELALSGPPPGYELTGDLFGLLSTDTLDLTGNTVTIGIEYGDTGPSGESLDPFELRIARLANGKAEVLADSTVDTVSSIVTTSYAPPPSSFGSDQLGEFVLVRPAAPPPPPATCTAELACPDGSWVACTGSTETSCLALPDACGVSCDGFFSGCCKQPPGCASPCGYCDCLANGGDVQGCYFLWCGGPPAPEES